MDLLVCAATVLELAAYPHATDVDSGTWARHGEIGFLVTGVGIPLALASVLQTAAREQPKRVLNIGIAGAYPGSGLAVGDVVTGESEVYGDIGMELPESPSFLAIRDTPFGVGYREPFSLTPWTTGVAVACGCTVNTCTGTEATGQRRAALFGAEFETMEGAAVAQAGALLGISVSEVRAISNIAADRDMRPENIRLALDRLTHFFQEHPHA